MSSLVSGVGKIFTSIGSGVAKLIPAVKAIGASVFTAGAATGSSSGALGGMFGGQGILGSMFNGVSSLFGGSTIGTTTGNFSGPWGLNLADAATAATSASGVFPKAPTVGLGVGGGGGESSGLIGQLLGSQAAMGAFAGLGSGIENYNQLQSIEDMQEKQLAHLNAAQQKVTDSYEVASSSLITGNDKPRQRTSTPRIKMPTVVKYNDTTGMLETVTA
jgi:hypothetical protein